MTDIDLTKPTPEQVKAAEELGRKLLEEWRKQELAADNWRQYDTRKDE